MRLETVTPDTLEDWIMLRLALWPGGAADHRAEALNAMENPDAVAFLAREGGAAVGFAEATLRHDYVNGCSTTPVGFLEGVYVMEGWRRRGIARALAAAVQDWTKTRGCTELASDAALDNGASHRMHAALGFSESERVVYFRKLLA